MNKMKKLLVVVTGTVLAIGMSLGPVMAGDQTSPTGRGVAQPGGTIKLKGNIIQYGSGGTTLNAGFNNLDTAQTWNCTGSTGCTIGVSAMVQLGNGGNWAICAVVDGNYINPPCPYQGNLPDTGSYVTGNSQQSYTVSSGSHTVQTQVYVTSSTTLANWQTTQQLFKGQ
ncbi:MAG TPA: hypothetical protein VMF67_16810 [Rhizomicrobium sp.]|nr:hypothetical protein [Rhizomicrobium sp.]